MVPGRPEGLVTAMSFAADPGPESCDRNGVHWRPLYTTTYLQQPPGAPHPLLGCALARGLDGGRGGRGGPLWRRHVIQVALHEALDEDLPPLSSYFQSLV